MKNRSHKLGRKFHLLYLSYVLTSLNLFFIIVVGQILPVLQKIEFHQNAFVVTLDFNTWISLSSFLR